MLTKPRKHQEGVLSTIDKRQYYGLFWEMGVGKTWVGCYLLDQHYTDADKKFLILCPSGVIDTWYKEILTHTDIDESVICKLQGAAAKRLKNLEDPKFSIYILNYEGLRVCESVIVKKQFDIIIADESQRLKSHKSQQTKIGIALKGKRKFILSGTPILNDYRDIFTQWLFMDGGKRFGNNFFAFQRKYFYDDNALRYRGNFSDWKIKPGADKLLMKQMSLDSHRLEKKDCLSLPDKIYKTLYCDLSPEQKRYYDEIVEDCITFIDGEKAVSTQHALTKLIRLHQITSGHVTPDETSDIHVFEENPKLDATVAAVDEILANPTSKLIIWAHFRHDIELLVKTFEKYNPVHIYGGVKNHGELVNKFQTDPTCRIFVGQAMSAGTGITLTAASYAIYYSYDFSAGNRAQSEDRCHRIGSERHESIVYIDIVCNKTIDEAILKAVREKKKMSDTVMTYIKEQNK